MIKKAAFMCPCCGENWIDPRIVTKLIEIEEDVCERLFISSGYRCEKQNRKVGGSKTSAHIKGLAADILCDRSRLRFRIVEAAIRMGFTRLGIAKDFVHVDLDRAKDARVIWVY
ncbi:MAG: D-Ala-D-Ala carboxypeptidase family metallohydrolase [Thermodesulfobacteriota bacterium]|nr:D-Ala-D-Ala carboxypeptidase family metallohydrolase [Thermodesulfobacteriota bacterium]